VEFLNLKDFPLDSQNQLIHLVIHCYCYFLLKDFHLMKVILDFRCYCCYCYFLNSHYYCYCYYYFQYFRYDCCYFQDSHFYYCCCFLGFHCFYCYFHVVIRDFLMEDCEFLHLLGYYVQLVLMVALMVGDFQDFHYLVVSGVLHLIPELVNAFLHYLLASCVIPHLELVYCAPQNFQVHYVQVKYVLILISLGFLDGEDLFYALHLIQLVLVCVLLHH